MNTTSPDLDDLDYLPATETENLVLRRVLGRRTGMVRDISWSENEKTILRRLDLII